MPKLKIRAFRYGRTYGLTEKLRFQKDTYRLGDLQAEGANEKFRVDDLMSFGVLENLDVSVSPRKKIEIQEFLEIKQWVLNLCTLQIMINKITTSTNQNHLGKGWTIIFCTNQLRFKYPKFVIQCFCCAPYGYICYILFD